MHHNLEISACDPLKMQNGQFHTYSINMHGKIHQNESFIDGLVSGSCLPFDLPLYLIYLAPQQPWKFWQGHQNLTESTSYRNVQHKFGSNPPTSSWNTLHTSVMQHCQNPHQKQYTPPSLSVRDIYLKPLKTQLIQILFFPIQSNVIPIFYEFTSFPYVQERFSKI